MAITHKRLVAGKAYGRTIYYYPTGRVKYLGDKYQFDGYFADKNYNGQLQHRFFVKNQKELLSAIKRGRKALTKYYEDNIEESSLINNSFGYKIENIS